MIFDEFDGIERGEPVATVRYRMETVAVAIAAGGRVPEELIQELDDLLEHSGSLDGAALNLFQEDHHQDRGSDIVVY